MAKLVLSAGQLHKLNKAYFTTELAAIQLRECLAEKERVFAEVQQETNSTFQTWNASTGETDFDCPDVDKAKKPRKSKA